VRLFLAITPDAACRARLARDMGPLHAEGDGIRWVRTDLLHVTLAFLGEVDEERRGMVREQVAPVAAAHPPFVARLSAGGVFPDWKRPRVVWIGFDDPGQLTRLGTDVGRVCASLGFRVDRAFRPHLTIGRVKAALSPTQRDRLARDLEALVGPYPFEVTRVELIQSELGPGGPRHTVLDSLPLGSG
jgi:2'-5' RNA ligase